MATTGPSTSAELDQPAGLAVDATGNLLIADKVNNTVRRVDAATGDITTVAGTGTCGFSGDGGPASSAQLCLPYDVAVSAIGDRFIADSQNKPGAADGRATESVVPGAATTRS